MVKHRTNSIDKLFREKIYTISKTLEKYHHVQVFDTHSNVDSNDQFDEIYSDADIRIIYNRVHEYIEMLTDDLCLKGELLHLFIEQDPEVESCYRII